MFTSHTLRGRLLNRALHHQHARIYNYDRTTKYGIFQEPCIDVTKQFLDFVHYDEGGRIFTYVLTLDAQLRFSETGKEFGIDLLSKHTMHSDVSIYIAYSGEFFIRRLKHPKAHKNDSSPDPTTQMHQPAPEPGESNENEKDKITNDDEGGEPISIKSCPSKDPSHYELIIDNDSGTYRPNAEKLPVLHDYLSKNLPGLKIVMLDCQADEEKMNKLKAEQRERKKKAGKQIMYLQNSSISSISSSEEEALETRAQGGQPRERMYKREMHKFMGGGRDEHHYPEAADEKMPEQMRFQTPDDNANGTADKSKLKSKADGQVDGAPEAEDGQKQQQ